MIGVTSILKLIRNVESLVRVHRSTILLPLIPGVCSATFHNSFTPDSNGTFHNSFTPDSRSV